MLNAKMLAEDASFTPPYLPGTQAVVIVATSQSKLSGSKPAGTWVMPLNEIEGLTPEPIASKFALPQVPPHIVDVTEPAGCQLQATIANDINIFPKLSIGGNGGWGGVQLQILNAPPKEQEFAKWFTNPRRLK